LSKVGLGFVYPLSIVFVVVFKGVSDSIMDSRRQVVHALVGLKGDPLGELFLVAIGVLECELLSFGDQGAMVELGFDATHGWGKSLVAVVAFGVASFRFAATGQAPVSGAVLLWCQVGSLPVPGAVSGYAGLVGYGRVWVGGIGGFVGEGEFVLGQVRGRRLAGAVVTVTRRGMPDGQAF
jgi:hypothetical protein